MAADSPSLLPSLLSNCAVPEGLLARDWELARSVVTEGAPAGTELRDALALPTPLGLALIEHAEKTQQANLAQTLAAAKETVVAKAAKKALYRLRSRGIVPVAPPAPEAASPASSSSSVSAELAPSEALDTGLEAFLTPLNGVGERALLYPHPMKRGGIEVLQIVFSDELGVTHIERHESSRSSYRKATRELTRSSPMAAVAISLAEGRSRLASAAALQAQTPDGIPQDIAQMLRHLHLTPSPRIIQIPAPSEADLVTAKGSRALHNEPEISSWLPPVEMLRTLGLKSDEVKVSELYIDDAQRQAQLGRVIDGLVDTFLEAPTRRLYAKRLWEMAIYFEADGRLTAAELARAEARALHNQPVGTPSSFVREMFEKVLALQQHLGHLSQPAQEGIPVHVAEGGNFAADPHRSPGGLILP